MNKKAIIPPYMLLFYKQKYGNITQKIHVAPIYHSKNSYISFEKFMLFQYAKT